MVIRIVTRLQVLIIRSGVIYFVLLMTVLSYENAHGRLAAFAHDPPYSPGVLKGTINGKVIELSLDIPKSWKMSKVKRTSSGGLTARLVKSDCPRGPYVGCGITAVLSLEIEPTKLKSVEKLANAEAARLKSLPDYRSSSTIAIERFGADIDGKKAFRIIVVGHDCIGAKKCTEIDNIITLQKGVLIRIGRTFASGESDVAGMLSSLHLIVK